MTLLVDTRQAKQLEVAMQEGSLSLALRNPLDTGSETADLVPHGPSTRPTVAAAISDKPAEPSQWEIKVIRGSETETRSFPVTDVEKMQTP